MFHVSKSDKGKLRVGSVIRARIETSLHPAGMCGVCFQVLRVNEKRFYGFIFANGAYDRFREEWVSSYIDYGGVVCTELAYYKFRKVLQLVEDYRRGMFAPAFRKPSGKV